MKLFDVVKTREAMTIYCLCTGCSVNDVKVKAFQGEQVMQEVTVDIGFPAVAKKAFGLVNQQYEFEVEPKFDVNKLTSVFGNGMLELNIPIKGGCVAEIKLEAAK